MFCFQCEQTAGSIGCTGKAGVCGKTAEIAGLQDALTGAVIGLAQVMDRHVPREDEAWRMLTQGLFATMTNVNFDGAEIRRRIDEIHAAQARLAPDRKTADYDMQAIWTADADSRSLKTLILLGLRGMAAYACHAETLGCTNAKMDRFFLKALSALTEDRSMEEWLPLLSELGKINMLSLEALDRGNTQAYGDPEPVQVSRKVEKGPFIVVTGHDLRDMELLLQQTADKGISVYTHGEMLPAHAYPKLRAYSHLKGHYGSAWHNQQKEFADLPAPVLYTANCLMPVGKTYADRAFTTGPVYYPGVVHIGEDKDFSPLIEKALSLGGYGEDRTFPGINGGETVNTGFGHGVLLAQSDKIIQLMESGAIRHIFLVGGCDGAAAGRRYYTEFVKQTPPDTLVLTLGCGKFRFHDLQLGEIQGIPRLIDLGQCNDAYSALLLAATLGNYFHRPVNKLPLSFILSWYEQKAVCILLTLLYLDVKNIRLGPTLPAFLSANVRQYLTDAYQLQPIATPEKDLQAILG